MAAPSVHAQFFHSSDDVVPSARKRGAFERPSDGPGCQRSGNFSYVALNCFDYTHSRDSAATDETRSDGKKGLHEYSGATYVHENCDDSLFDSLDCLGDEFLGSSAADLSFSYLPVSPSNDVFVNHQDNFETRRPNGKGGLTPLLMKSANSSHADDNDEVCYSQRVMSESSSVHFIDPSYLSIYRAPHIPEICNERKRTSFSNLSAKVFTLPWFICFGGMPCSSISSMVFCVVS